MNQIQSADFHPLKTDFIRTELGINPANTFYFLVFSVNMGKYKQQSLRNEMRNE